MSGSYEDYEREYNAHLSRIRSFLAGSTRTQSTLTECERLLQEAKQCATAMQGEAEVSGDAMRITEARQHLERDIAPLSREVARQLNEIVNNSSSSNIDSSNREALFYQAPTAADVEQQQQQQEDSSLMMQSLIQSSDDMLRESQSVLAETEHVGNETLMQMGRQREQLQNANTSLQAVQNAAGRAHRILRDMSRRACRSRLALYAMIATLGAANLWVLYAIYKKHHPTQQQSSSNDGGDW